MVNPPNRPDPEMFGFPKPPDHPKCSCKLSVCYTNQNRVFRGGPYDGEVVGGNGVWSGNEQSDARYVTIPVLIGGKPLSPPRWSVYAVTETELVWLTDVDSIGDGIEFMAARSDSIRKGKERAFDAAVARRNSPG